MEANDIKTNGGATGGRQIRPWAGAITRRETWVYWGQVQARKIKA